MPGEAGLLFFVVGSMLVVIGVAGLKLVVDWRRRVRREAREWRPEYELMTSTRIEPARKREMTAYVRIEPDPMDYRKAVKTIEGIPEDPFGAINEREPLRGP